MPRERKNLQVSIEAFKRLQKLNQNTGMSFIDLIDSLAGVDNDLETKQKDQKAFKESGLPIKEWAQKEIAGARKYAPVDKPDSCILDCAILSTWDSEYMAIMIERDVPSPDTEDLMNRNRSAIKMNVILKMLDGWSELYPKWFEDYNKNQSQFEITLNARLKALVKANLLISDSTGVYKLSPILAGTGIDYLDKVAAKHWTIINGINAIKPNPDMKLFKTRSGIKNLFDERRIKNGVHERT
tara:strand:- start:631 stop:1353 length:723 start_codon:yes stop_codon:yes gene_type:complete